MPLQFERSPIYILSKTSEMSQTERGHFGKFLLTWSQRVAFTVAEIHENKIQFVVGLGFHSWREGGQGVLTVWS